MPSDEPVNCSSRQRPGARAFGLEGTTADRCFFQRTESFGRAVGAIIEQAKISDLRSIVVLNDEMQDGACAAGDLMIVDRGQVEGPNPGVVPHEFGHVVGGLFDESEGPEHRPKVTGPNCSSTSTAPSLPWPETLGTRRGCWQDLRLFATDVSCRMKDSTVDEFCAPCEQRLHDVLSGASIESSTSAYTQVVVQFWRPEAHITPQVVAFNHFDGRKPKPIARGPVMTAVLNGAEQAICFGSSLPDETMGRSYDASGRDLPTIVPASGSRDDILRSDSVLAVLYCDGHIERNAIQKLQRVRVEVTASPWLTPEMFNRARDTDSLQRFESVR